MKEIIRFGRPVQVCPPNNYGVRCAPSVFTGNTERGPTYEPMSPVAALAFTKWLFDTHGTHMLTLVRRKK